MNDNTKNQTREQDKATGRPWKVKEDGHYFWILGNEKTEKGTKAVFVI